MAGFNIRSSHNLQLNPKEQDGNGKQKNKARTVQDPLAKYICLRCKKGDSEECMLLCDGCDDSYHTFCLLPPLTEVPKGEWRCPQCVAEEVSKPSEAFGFEQAQREYTLQQFGEMADKFKCEYFNKPLHKIEADVIEKEFWRIVSAIDEDVTVEYGADLHSMDHGSGFPTEGSKNVLQGEEVYIKSGWNLNNLPVLSGSVLGHINADISGMKVPWMYVGMCFSTFCWHNEDHWSYSINYLHWGEPKTWYGVPGNRADDFEAAMKQAAPELFESQPDLLHQLVTIMNPNILMKAGVPVYRIDQLAGEFVVTFPRAYHAGFNQGYNFAEAVNFAPPDWLAMGRSCIEHYSMLHRYCVFAHDELVCKMGTEPEKLTVMVAMATYQDLLTMLEAEREHRRIVNSWGVTKSERKPYELLPDDERLCEYCKTTCFLSAIVCSCTTKLSCLKHYDKLCDCPSSAHTLMYRYTLDEIPEMMTKLKARCDEYNDWVQQLEKAFKSEGDNRIELDDLKEMLLEAETKGYPKTPLRDSGSRILDEAEKCVVVAQRLASPAIKTRHRNINESRVKVTVDELQIFADQMDTLEVKIRESTTIRQLLAKVRDFKIRAKELFEEEDPNVDELKACLNEGEEMRVELEEVLMIKSCLDRTKWVEQMDAAFESECIWTLEYLNKAIDAGQRLEKMNQVESRLNKLEDVRDHLITLETKAKSMIGNIKECKVQEFEKLIKESKKFNIALPSLPTVRNLLRQANDYLMSLKQEPEDEIFEFEEATKKRKNDSNDDESADENIDWRKSLRNSGPKPLSKNPRNLENKKPRKRRKSGNTSKNEEYNEDCAAVPCLQPTGNQVNWVQCDAGCEGWFHLTCLGMQKSQVDHMEHFECNPCKGNSRRRKSSGNAGSLSDENSRDFDNNAQCNEALSVSSSNILYNW